MSLNHWTAILPHIQISNHYAVYLKLIDYMSIISKKGKEGREWEGNEKWCLKLERARAGNGAVSRITEDVIRVTLISCLDFFNSILIAPHSNLPIWLAHSTQADSLKNINQIILFPCHNMRGLVDHCKESEFHDKNRKTLMKYKNINTV